MKKEACRSKSSIWRFRSGLSPPWVVMSTGTDSGVAALWGPMRSYHAASRGPAASVMPCRANSLYPVPGRAEWLSLDAMKPKRKRRGWAGSSKFEMASAYCAELPGRMLKAGLKQSRHCPQSFQSSTVVPGTVSRPPTPARR